MSDDISIRFTADTSGLMGGIQQVSGAMATAIGSLRSGAGQMRSDFQALSQAATDNAAQSVSATDRATRQREQINAAFERADYDNQLNAVKLQTSLVKEAAQTSQMSRQDELAKLLALEAQRESLETAHYDRLGIVYQNDAVKYARVQAQKSELESQSALRRQQITAQINQQTYNDYRRTFEQVGSSVASGIMGMIRGQETFGQAARNVALSIVQSFIQARIRSVADWLAGLATKVTATQTAEAAQTAATAAGVATRTTAEETGSAASMATTFASILKSITASATETFAGIFGFLSPVMGPAAVGPAAAGQATVLAAGAAIPSFDTGAWSLPADMIAQVHQGEMIVPAGPAAALRGMMADGGSTGAVNVQHSTNFSVSAVDARSVKRFFASNGKDILRAINDSVKNGAHLGLGKLNAPVGL